MVGRHPTWLRDFLATMITLAHVMATQFSKPLPLPATFVSTPINKKTMSAPKADDQPRLGCPFQVGRLPPELIVDILGELDYQTLVTCKRACS
jgi:hypothetical protein